jgi:hypothetical protein
MAPGRSKGIAGSSAGSPRLEVDYIPMPDGHRELNHSDCEAPPEAPSQPVFHAIDRPGAASSLFEEPPVER